MPLLLLLAAIIFFPVLAPLAVGAAAIAGVWFFLMLVVSIIGGIFL